MIGVQELDLSHGGLVITLFSGEHGWTMDRGGVSDMPEDTVAEFQEAVRRGSDNLLRLSLKDPGVGVHWGGGGRGGLGEVGLGGVKDQGERGYRLAGGR